MSEIFSKEVVGKVVIPATKLRFVTRDNIKVNNGFDASVRISDIRGDFGRLYLAKIEELADEHVLHYRTLREPVGDSSVVEELGGEDNAKTSLAAKFYLMKQQRSA